MVQPSLKLVEGFIMLGFASNTHGSVLHDTYNKNKEISFIIMEGKSIISFLFLFTVGQFFAFSTRWELIHLYLESYNSQ